MVGAAHLRAQAPAAPAEIGKEFVAYLTRRDFDSLNNVIARDSFNRLGAQGVRAVLANLNQIPTRWESTSNGNAAQVTPIYEPMPVICRRQGIFWRVDLIATATQWLKFPDEKVLERKFSYLPQHGSEAREICAGNLKALGVALQQYAEDYDNRYPPARSWTNVLRPYLTNRQALHCPTAGKYRFGYALNQNLSSQEWPKITEKSAKFVVLYETKQLRANAFQTGRDLDFRHEGWTQVLMSDATIMSLKDAKTLNFNVPMVGKK